MSGNFSRKSGNPSAGVHREKKFPTSADHRQQRLGAIVAGELTSADQHCRHWQINIGRSKLSLRANRC
jgi:hypothetical protein